jgi:hypothetical protein
VLVSAIADGRRLRRGLGRTQALTIAGRLVFIDGVEARVDRGWLGPGWTVMWLRMSKQRRRVVSIWRSECTAADHAALRRSLVEIDFG